MTLGWGILTWAMVVWVSPLMYFTLKNECRPKKNIIVGVTLPYEAHHDPAVTALLGRYTKEMKLACRISLAVVAPCLLIRSVGVFMTVWITWTVAVCFVYLIPYVRCNKALRALKAARGWRREGAPQVVTDLKAAAEEMRWISPWWFLPPFLISLVPLLFDRVLWWVWTLCAALIPLFYLCYRYLYRNRAEVVDEDSGRTLTLTHIRRYNWGKCWLAMAWATGVFNVGFWLTLGHVWRCMAVILAYGLTASAVVLGLEFRVRRLQEKLGNTRGGYVDEDDRWIWGIFYYNPNDRRTLVNARIGMNSTVNLARRPAQALMALCLALLLACPLGGVWLIGMERAPVELEVTETEIVGSHYGGHWRVALADVAEVRILEERPPLRRIAGTGMENALTGQFGADPWGRLTCCIDPRTGPWLLVKKTDGSLYLFGASDRGAVAEAAAKLQ